jgi:hypothetical protein
MLHVGVILLSAVAMMYGLVNVQPMLLGIGPAWAHTVDANCVGEQYYHLPVLHPIGEGVPCMLCRPVSALSMTCVQLQQLQHCQSVRHVQYRRLPAMRGDWLGTLAVRAQCETGLVESARCHCCK